MAGWTWTGAAGDGQWNTAGNWSPASVPNNSSSPVSVPTGASIALGNNVEIQNLQFTGSGTATISGAHTLTLDGSITLAAGQTLDLPSVNTVVDQGLTLSGSGQFGLTGNGSSTISVNSALTVGSGSNLTLTDINFTSVNTAAGPGTVTLDGSTATFNGAAPTTAFVLDFNTGTNTLNLPSYTNNITVQNFGYGDTVHIGNDQLALTDNGNGTYTLKDTTSGSTLSHSVTLEPGATVSDFVNTPGVGFQYNPSLPPPCFCAGTHILTERGEVLVEELRIGDLVMTAAGAMKPVRWLGHRRLRCDVHPDPQALWPVRIAKDAFGESRPTRDLWLSPGHCIRSGSVLIPVSVLQNGQTIAQIPRSMIEYWHVEFDRHDLILAEGLAVESYLDTGNRTSFVNGGAFLDLHPELEPHHWSDTCQPLVFEGDAVVRAKAALLERVKALGYRTTPEPDLHILADDRRVEPVHLGAWRYLFVPPEGCARIVLCSRSFIPAHISAASFDRRTLGVCVGRLQIDGEEVPLDRSTSFGAGWDELERDGSRGMWRWTNGQASLPAKTRAVLIDLAGPGHYWEEPEPCAMAKVA